MSKDLAGELRLELEQLVDCFVVKGGKASEIIVALQRELIEMRAAYEEDPDPSDDPPVVDEPSNDWPGAES